MNKIYFLFLVISISKISLAQQGFTTGNLVVYRVNTNPADSLSDAGFPVSIDEYSPTGTFVRAHPMPVVLNGNNKRIISSGTANTEGQLTRSSDKKFLLIPGYDTFPDKTRRSLSGSSSLVINRVVGILDGNGILDATTALKNTYSGSSIRGVASTNGIDLWLAGTGSGSSNGIRYTKKGMDTSIRLSTTVTNTRVVNVFEGQVYCTTGSGSFKGISAVGNGLPADSQQVITMLNGFDTAANSPANPYAFSIKPVTGDVIYLADFRSKRLGGGVQKWTKVADKWSLAYTLDSGLTNGLLNIAVDWDTPNPSIYAISSEVTKKDSLGNKIMKTTDIDSTSAFTVIATAGTNSTFRGIAFAPEPSAATVVYTFTGNGNWDVQTNWSNNTIPPATLPAGSEIIINHIPNGTCILNITETIAAGAKLTVNTGKNITVPGVLDIQ